MSGTPTKSDMLVTCLRRPEGATVAQICEVTGWLPHSVRGFMAGALRKRFSLSVISEAAETGRVYRIAAPGVDA